MSEYKNILWIDDMDKSEEDASPDMSYLDDEEEDEFVLTGSDQNTIKDLFGTELQNNVFLIKKYRTALRTLEKNCSDYDLIVFDLNFAHDTDIDSWYTDICELLKKGNVMPTDKAGKELLTDSFKLVAGYYLYLFLAMKGFPTNRMIILTGNYSEGYHGQTPDIYLTMLDEASNCYNDDWDIITKDIAQTCVNNNCDWLARFYDKEKSHYYCIRRLVFYACAYWESRLSSDLKEEMDIPFNKVYFNNDKTKENRITSNNFIEMLEHIKMLFPVTVPACPEKVYYQALKALSMFHEHSAKIEILDGKQLKRFHSCIRNFRNWSSHNKLRTELSGDKFAILFCIALRTYFQWEDDLSLDADDLQPYEKIYGFDSEIAMPDRPQIINLWLKIWNIVTGDPSIKDLKWTIESNIRDYGKKDNVKMDDYIFSPIWLTESRMFTIKVDYNPGKNKLDSQVNYFPDCNIEEFLKRATSPTNSEGIFMRYCYRWFVGEEA